jgi:hypothetical protein
MKTSIITSAIVLACALGSAVIAGNPPGTGQPGVECEDIHPGQSDSARGSAFNPNGIAGTVYAGEQAVNSKNPKSVSQYDVACLQQENRIANQEAKSQNNGGKH